MNPFTVGKIRKLLNGSLIQGSDELIINDAAYFAERISKTNTLFFIFTKYEIDLKVIDKWAPCIIVTNKIFEELKPIKGCTIILVEDIHDAFWKFAEYYRSLFEIPIIAVTGTCGKTTTKDMIKHILQYSYRIVGTKSSANGRPNHFPYLMSIDDNTEAAVFETPVGEPGDITYSCKYYRPTIGIITNIGIDHLAGCKTQEGYIQAKAEMVNAVDTQGILILNADDENIKKIDLDKFEGRIVYFGIHNPADFRASNIQYGENGMNFVLTFQHIRQQVFVPGYGEHQVYNALAAFAAVHELGIGFREAAERLQSFETLPAHLELIHGLNDCLILNDTWNSNPTSLRAALKVLDSIAHGRKKIALLSHIRMLGDSTEEIHHLVGDMLAEAEVDILITFNPIAEIIGTQAREKGFNGEIYGFSDISLLSAFLKKILNQDTIILIKSDMGDGCFHPLLKDLKAK